LILTAPAETMVLNTLVSRCVRLRIPPLERELILAELSEKMDLTGPKATLLAGLSGGTLGLALSIDPDVAFELWEELNNVMSFSSGFARLSAALDWNGYLISELSKHKAAKDGQGNKRKAEFLDLILTSFRLWWRDTTILAATKDPSRLIGPPPTSAQQSMAANLSLKQLGRYERSVTVLADRLSRFLDAEQCFENYWLDVLQ
jgi:hypothetical protein